MAAAELVVLDGSRRLAFSFDDLLRFHGGGSPGGVAHAFKVLELGLALLAGEGGSPPQRRGIEVRTPFGGPGARDAFEIVTRAVTEGRYVLDGSLARPERGRAMERFVFRLGYRGRSVTLIVREGFVTDEFVDLARMQQRSDEDEARLDRLKAEMAERVMARPAGEVYEVVEG